MKNKNNLFLSLVLTSLCFLSCAKDGATGPQGPQGPAGTDGINGTNGTNGTNGANGNANVISKSAQTVSFTYYAGKNAYDAYLSCPEITQEVVDNGVVLCYERVAPNQWMPWNANIGTTYYIYNFKLGEIVLEYRNTAGTTTNEGDKTMRFIIIPSQDIPKLPKDLSDFTEVTKALKIN